MVTQAAGIAYICSEESAILLVRRSALVTEPGTWALPGGRVEPAEHPYDAAMREVEEELGSAPQGELLHAAVATERGFQYVTYFVLVTPIVKARWTKTIILNWENDAARWWPADALPEPLHYGVAELRGVIEQIAGV